jgi:hypothetical protein
MGTIPTSLLHPIRGLAMSLMLPALDNRFEFAGWHMYVLIIFF